MATSSGSTAERDLDMVVVCEINVDIVVTGLSVPLAFGAERLVDGVTLTAGSSGVLAATNMADIGLRVGVCGLVGDDTFGRYMLDHLERHGIDRSGVVVDPAVQTGAGVLLSTPQDRAILTYAGAMVLFEAEQVAMDVVARARHLHLSSYFLQAGLQRGVPELLERAHRLGLTTSADTGHDPAEQWELGGLLGGVDVFLPNEVEAAAITGLADPEHALDRLAERVPTVALKRGAAGALAAAGGQRVFVPAFTVEAVDTTGAGDAFDAGFLSGYLGGEDLEACVRRGNACGALTAAHVGGSGALTPERVAALLANS